LTRNSKRILGDSDLGGPQLRAELARVWTKFVAALAASADLIASDRELIAADVADDLERRRIARDSPNPFVETRSLEGRTDRSPAAAFDFAEIAFQRELGGESRHGVFTGENPFG